MTTTVLPFPQRPRSAANSITPAELSVGDWFITRGEHAHGPGSWISWVVEIAPEDQGGCIGLAVRALPLVAPDGSWPYDHLERGASYWVPISSIEITCPMPAVEAEP